MKDNNPPVVPFKQKPEPDKLRGFFTTHLNRVYCAKTHLVSRLPEIEGNAHFNDLQLAIAETREVVKNQIEKMQEIYALLNEDVSIEPFKGMTGLIDDAFTAIQQHSNDPWLRDMSILFYLQNIENLEIASFQALQIAAVKLKNKDIERLLKENFNSAKADRSLLLILSAKYILG
jgi:ferritin-like metal-binding protein YciE